jgi:hypothetical protein
MPYALAMSGGALYAGLADGRIYVSEDRGDRWRVLELTGERLPSILALAIAD